MPQSISRRGFLEKAAVGGAAASLALSSTVSAAANDKVVIGVMGLSRGKELAAGFSKLQNVEIKYCCDVDRQRAESGAEQVAANGSRRPEIITDFRRILDDKDVDALICAAPNHWHGPATIMACGAGKHVYVEKPCSHNPYEGEMMIQAARKNKCAVQMGAQRRSGATMALAMKLLHENAIGRAYLSRGWYYNLRSSIGIGKPASVPSNLDYELWQGPAPRRPYLDNRVHYNWHWFWHWGNGELGNNGVHTLDLCRWGLNVDYPIRVTSSGGRYAFKDDQETPDTHTVCYEFEGNRQISWEGLSCNRHGDGFVKFYGTEGSMDLEQDGSFRIYDKRDKLIRQEKSSGRGDREHMVNFVEAIRNDKPLALNAEIAEGHKSTLLCHLGNIAQRVSASLTTDSANGHIVGNPAAAALWKREYEKGWEPEV